MKRIVLTLLISLNCALAYAQTSPTFSLTADDQTKISAQVDGIKEYIKSGYDYEAAGDTEFGTIVQSFLDNTAFYLGRKILVDKAEEYYKGDAYVGASGLSGIDELVKENLGYNSTHVDSRIDALARIFKYKIYPVLFAKNTIEASPYAGWKKDFTDAVDDVTLTPTSGIPQETEDLAAQLIDIRDNLLKKAEKNIKEVKESISLKSADYVAQSEMEREPLQYYSSPYKKEEVMRYAMAVNMELRNKVIAAEIKEKIATLEWMKLNPGKNDKELADTQLKLKAYRKYVFRYNMKSKLNVLCMVGKEFESSIYMMVALGVQDIAFYKFPNVFLDKERAAFYQQFTNDTFKQYMKDRFFNVNNLSAYKSFGAFVLTSRLVRAIPAPSFMLKMSKWADSQLWGVGGTRIRGIALFAISMTAASKISEAVSLYDNFSGELNFDDEGLDFIKDTPELMDVKLELKKLTKSYISEELYYSFSDFMVSTGNFLTSFAVSEMALKQLYGRAIPWGYYAAKRVLNKTKCRGLLDKIEDKLKNAPAAVKYSGNIFKAIFLDGASMFLLASVIEKYMVEGESYFINNEQKEKDVNDILGKLSKLEYELLGTGLKAYMADPQERMAMYDKLDDLKLIEDIVEYLRTNDGWVVGTIQKKLDDESKTLAQRNTDVDDFLSLVFDAVKGSKISRNPLNLLEGQYKANVGYKAATKDIYGEENHKQLLNAATKQLEFVAANGDKVTKEVGNLEPEIKVGATQAVQEKTFKDQTLFTRLRQGLWGADEKSLLADVMKDRYGDVAYKDYYDFYSNFIDSAYNYSGTPAQKITNLLNNLYPNFVEDPLMQDNDYQAFADFGEDILDAVVFGIYSEFMVGVNTLPKDSDKYWTYMDTIVLSSLTKGLSGDKTYSDRTSNYMQLTLFTILSAPYCALDWGAFKEWKENADNINKTYKDFAFEKWLAKNPNKGKKSSEELFDDYSSEMWRSFVASDTSKTSAVKADSIYNFIWEPRRKARGF